MYLVKLIALSLLCFLTSCNRSSSFNRDIWIENPRMEDTHNPRARMVQDVMKRQLKAGMSRKSVLALLGKPYREGTEPRLPKNTILPDSFSVRTPEAFSRENQKKRMDAFNNFVRLHAEQIMLMRYPVGWSTMDPRFLIIKLNNKGLVEDYWVEQG